MNAALDWASAVLVLAGSLFALTAGIGLVRFPDTLSRMHPSTKTQVLGLLLVLVGAGLRLRGSVDVGMLVLAGLFTVIVSPVFAHLVGRAAYRERGLRVDLLTRDDMPADAAADEDNDEDDGDAGADDAPDDGAGDGLLVERADGASDGPDGDAPGAGADPDAGDGGGTPR